MKSTMTKSFTRLFLLLALFAKNKVLGQPADSQFRTQPFVAKNTTRVFVTSKDGPATKYIPASGILHYNWPQVNIAVITVFSDEAEVLKRNPNLTVEEDVIRRFAFFETESDSTIRHHSRSSMRSNKVTGASMNRQLQFSPQWGFDAVQAGLLHSQGIRGQGVKVCVVDSGLDTNHSEFYQANLSGYSQNPSLQWDRDPYGHGTKVTGVMAANEQDGIGIHGVAPDAEYYIVRVLNEIGFFMFSSSLIDAVFDCFNAGARIINLSLVGYEENDSEKEFFASLADAGVLVVAAAGNTDAGTGTSTGYPASYPSVLSVAAINESRQHWPSSNANEFVDLAAPGAEILTTLPGGRFSSVSGTSLAAPFVSGVAALLWSHRPEARASEIWSALIEGALDLGSVGHDDFFGYGLIQAMNSLGYLDDVYRPSASPSPPQITSTPVGSIPTLPSGKPPNPGYPPCNICGPGDERITNTDAIVVIFGQDQGTCQDFQSSGDQGFIGPELCPMIPSLVAVCGCAMPSPAVRPFSTLAPQPTPNPTPQPTINPTEGPTKSLRGRLVSLISQHLPSTSFANSSSSQSLALEWLQSDNFATSQQLHDSRLLQRFALATTFFSFGREDTLQQSDECGWGGGWIEMRCDSLSGVVYLRSGEQKVSGTIPPEISLLTALTHLDLDLNSLTRTIPPQLSTLTALAVLDVSGNDLTGTIPTQLSEITTLRWLDLQNNQLTGSIPPQLSALRGLTRLHLQSNALTGSIPRQLYALTMLQDLRLHSNQLMGTIPPNLADLTLLQYLYLHRNQLTGTVPSALCSIGTKFIYVDKAVFECVCCSCCS